MTRLLHGSVHDIPDEEVGSYMSVLPAFMHAEIYRYHHINDQKTKLLARLMLYRALCDDNQARLIHQWKRDKNNKPYIGAWRSFNISHSGEMVVLGISDSCIGVDIEQRRPLNYLQIINEFHPAEQEFIQRAVDPQEAFYEIWVKKEALLKAIGTGIVYGLNTFNCTDWFVHSPDCRWYLHSLNLHPHYTAYWCAAHTERNYIQSRFYPSICIK